MALTRREFFLGFFEKRKVEVISDQSAVSEYRNEIAIGHIADLQVGNVHPFYKYGFLVLVFSEGIAAIKNENINNNKLISFEIKMNVNGTLTVNIKNENKTNFIFSTMLNEMKDIENSEKITEEKVWQTAKILIRGAESSSKALA